MIAAIIPKGKAISPLIATVILVAFVVGIGIIITSSFTTMTKTQTNLATRNANCPGAVLDIVSATCNATSNELQIVVTNAGSIKLQNFSLTATIDGKLYTNSTPAGITELSPGSSGKITADIGQNGTISKLRVNVGNCPGMFVEITNETVPIATC